MKEGYVIVLTSWLTAWLFGAITFIFIGAELNIGAGMDLRSGVSAAIACMGNVGPGFGQSL